MVLTPLCTFLFINFLPIDFDELTFSNVLAPPLLLLLTHDLVTCYVVMNINQVPQTGVVGASNLASTYGLGNYGTYGSAALNGALYGSSLPFLPSVFYRTRF